jgi:hypothetical protein
LWMHHLMRYWMRSAGSWCATVSKMGLLCDF